jgi:hypothetical protein
MFLGDYTLIDIHFRGGRRNRRVDFAVGGWRGGCERHGRQVMARQGVTQLASASHLHTAQQRLHRREDAFPRWRFGSVFRTPRPRSWACRARRRRSRGTACAAS